MKNRILYLIKMASKNLLYGMLIQLAFFTLVFAENGNAQVKALNEVQIKLEKKSWTLKEIFEKIEQTTDFRFVYPVEFTVENPKVSIAKSSNSVEEILEAVSKEAGYKFQQINNSIYVAKINTVEPKIIPQVVEAVAAIPVKGKVIANEDRQPIPGVNILVKGTSIGTTTDMDGAYSLNVPDENSVLVFSFIGYTAEEVPLSGRSIIDVTMVADVTQLQEIVIVDVGYGTMKRSDLTGAVSSVSGAELQKIPIASVGEAMTGRLPGVQVTTTEGSPDADIKIRVRGGGSITQDNSPLYIVDGFPVSSISSIPPTDIQSIDVLKDASSTAIYGARGANGVVIITTKSGKEGKVTVDFNAYAGVRTMANKLKVLNPYEYVMYQYEIDQTETFKNYYGAFEDLEIYKSVKGKDWVNEVFGRNGLIQNYNLSLNGGGKTTRYALSFTRADEESIMIGSNFERNNFNLKLTTDLGERFTLDFNNRLNYTVIDGAGVSSGAGSNTRLRNSVKYAPTLGLREFSASSLNDDDTNSPETSSLLYNPVESTYDEYKKQYQFSNNFNGALNVKLIKDLSFRSEWGYEFKKYRTDQVWGPSTANSKNNGGQPIGQVYYNDGSSWRNANTLTYDKKNLFEGHNLNLLLGQEVISSVTKTVTNESRYFPLNMSNTDVLAVMNFGKPQNTSTYIGADNNLASFFSRANYSVFDKYLLTLTFRADGSSKFAKRNQWGYFPSAALAWKLSEETFIKQMTWISSLKVRTSYGASGNNRIADGLWNATYNTGNDDNPYWPGGIEVSQLRPATNLSNPELKWETTYTRNFGIDFGVLEHRLSGTFDLYWNTTKDLLIAAPLPSSSGISTQYQNIGQTSNKGIELSLDGLIIDKNDFSLNAVFNIGFNRNNVDKFQNGDANFKTYTSGWNGSSEPLNDYILQEGEPVGLMYGYVTEGMYSFDDFTFNATKQVWEINEGVVSTQPVTSSLFGPGMLKFKDVLKDGKIDANDKQVIGNANPKHTGGFGLNARYKAIDFSAFFNWSFGNDIYNANKIDYTTQLLSRRYQNLTDEMSLSNRFTIIDPVTGYNVYSGKNANPERLMEINKNATIWSPIMTLTPLHSWAIEDGSFLRINNLSIGYSLPQAVLDRLKINRLRFYVTGYNLYTFTNYSGFDPEVDTRRSTPLTPGVDYSAYPRSRSFIGGINLTF